MSTLTTADQSPHLRIPTQFTLSTSSMKQLDTPGSIVSLTSPRRQLSTSSRSGKQWSKINPGIESNSFAQIKPKNSLASTLSLPTSTPAASFTKLPQDTPLNRTAWSNAYIELFSTWSDPCFNTLKSLRHSGTKLSTQPTKFAIVYRPNHFPTQSHHMKPGLVPQ